MKFRITITFLLGSLLLNCSMTSMDSAFNEPSPYDLTALDDTTKNYVLFFNSSGGLSHGIDRTGHIHAWLNGKPLGYFKMKHYRILEIPPGEYTVKLQHRDVLLFKSDHTLTITRDTKLIEMEVTTMSNELRVVDMLPEDFEGRYRKAMNRNGESSIRE